jgi:hypothetical protein
MAQRDRSLKPDVALLPSPSELGKLQPEVAVEVIGYADRVNRRDTYYANLGIICAVVSFLSCVGAFVHLVETGHPNAAGLVFGTAVLGVIGKFIDSRMRK